MMKCFEAVDRGEKNKRSNVIDKTESMHWTSSEEEEGTENNVSEWQQCY